MANEAIGQIKCPCCSSSKARVSVGANGRAYVTCSACHVQMFCRSDYSDTLVRANMRPIERKAPEAAAPAMPEPPPGMEIAPKAAPVEKPAPVAQEVKEAAPESAPVKQKSKWDFF